MRLGTILASGSQYIVGTNGPPNVAYAGVTTGTTTLYGLPAATTGR